MNFLMQIMLEKIILYLKELNLENGWELIGFYIIHCLLMMELEVVLFIIKMQ